ncbi:hypothetical protein D9M71_707860 [compost metagenome]
MHGAGVIVTRQDHARLEHHAQHPDAGAGVEKQRLHVNARHARQGVPVHRQLVGIEGQQVFVFVDLMGHRHFLVLLMIGFGSRSDQSTCCIRRLVKI